MWQLLWYMYPLLEWANKWCACWCKQGTYIIQSVLHLAGSIRPDTARKLSLKVLAGTSSFRSTMYIHVLGKSRAFNTEVLMGTSRSVSSW